MNREGIFSLALYNYLGLTLYPEPKAARVIARNQSTLCISHLPFDKEQLGRFCWKWAPASVLIWLTFCIATSKISLQGRTSQVWHCSCQVLTPDTGGKERYVTWKDNTSLEKNYLIQNSPGNYWAPMTAFSIYRLLHTGAIRTTLDNYEVIAHMIYKTAYPERKGISLTIPIALGIYPMFA